MPTVWDETRLLGGYPAEYVLMARRHGNVWYIGALNGLNDSHTLTIDWSFLQLGMYDVMLFEDSGNNDNPWKITSMQASPNDIPVQFDCQPRGGAVIVISPTLFDS